MVVEILLPALLLHLSPVLGEPTENQRAHAELLMLFMMQTMTAGAYAKGGSFLTMPKPESIN